MQKLFAFLYLGIIFVSCSKSPTNPQPPAPSSADLLNGWQKINTNITGGFSDIAFNTPATGVLATGNEVYRSADSGKTWVLEPSITANPVTINFFNQQYGYAVGEKGMQITTNGGQSWRDKSVANGFFLDDVCFVSPSTGYVARPSGTILKTKDTGNTWQTVAYSTNGHAAAVDFINEQQGWYSKNDSLFRTTNGGSTWVSQTTAYNSPIYTIFFADASNGWFTADTLVYKTTDGGVNWLRIGVGASTYELQFFNAQTGYVSTSKGVLKTTDGGLTWKQNLTASLPFFSELCFLDENTGWVTGSNNIIYRWKK